MADPHKMRARRGGDKKLDQLSGAGVHNRRGRDLNAKAGVLLDKGEGDPLEHLERSPETFRANLQYILRTFGVEVRQLSQELGVEYRWLRRAVNKGLERRVPRLDKLAHHFGLPDGHYFWAEDITKFLETAPPRPEALKTWKQNLNWCYAERLLELLEAGKHDFLKELIDHLYGSQFPQATLETAESHRVDESMEQVGDIPAHEESSEEWDVQPGAAAFCMPDVKGKRKRRSL
jgi:hypothetical protein